jgi:glycosyltransferase involved in cell wall biosynthesis
LIEGFKINTYVEKLERLIKNSELRKKFGEAAYKTCSASFSQEKITTDLIDIWLED